MKKTLHPGEGSFLSPPEAGLPFAGFLGWPGKERQAALIATLRFGSD
jgi:hypothetical protein